MSEKGTKDATSRFALEPGMSAVAYGQELVRRYHLNPIEGGPIHQLPLQARGDRRIPLASKGHCTTHAVMGRGAGRRINGESWTELRHQWLLNAKSNVIDIREQALFMFGWKRERKHFFDMLVTLEGGLRIACTVKPVIRLRSGKFMNEMREIAWWVEKLSFADETRLLTDEDIDPIELHNARLFAALRDNDPTADLAAQAVVSTLPDGTSHELRALTRETGIAARGYRALLRCVQDGILVLEKREPIVPATRVMRASGSGAALGWKPSAPMTLTAIESA